MKTTQCDFNCPLINARYVPSEINSKSKVLFLVEAPGKDEVAMGKPLVGIAGQDLMTIISWSGHTREDGNYINAVSCRPTKVNDGKISNRTPTIDEINCCNLRLYSEIIAFNPSIIVCMGKTPYVALGGERKALMRDIVGEFITYGNYDVILAYHPAAIAHSGGISTQRGKAIASKISEVVSVAFNFKPSDKQLKMWG